MLRWVVGTFHHGGTIDCFSLQSVLNDFSNKDGGECYNVCSIGHIRTIATNKKIRPCSDGSGFPL